MDFNNSPLQNLDLSYYGIKNKVYVKAHPNFTIRGYHDEACAMDKYIFSLIRNKFKFSKRLIFEDEPTKNSDLLKMINKSDSEGKSWIRIEKVEKDE